MMLCKPIVALIAVSAAASTVTASATPMRRGDGGWPPSYTPSIPINQCIGGSEQCCDQYTSSNDPSALPLAAMIGVALTGNVGMGCTNLAEVGGPCNTNQVCCENVYQNGLINTGCSPLVGPVG